MSDKLSQLIARLPDYLGGHMLLSVTALLVGLALSVPLGVLAIRRPRLAETLLGIAGILQTIPSLALLVIMVPLLGTIGFGPACVALTIYSILPILAGVIVGIRGVDLTLIEAAQGLGMSPRQMLLRVQLPLALPVIVSGIRTATVMTVGTATLATPVGGKSLGNYIFAGLSMNDLGSTVFGCVVTGMLAVLMDQLVRILEVAARRRSQRLALIGAAGLLLLLAGGLYQPIANLFAPRAVIGAYSSFSEQYILFEVCKDRLQATGYRVEDCPSVGSAIQGLAFRNNQIDFSVNYSGDVWSIFMGRKEVVGREETYEQAKTFLHDNYGIECLGKVGFRNEYALAMDGERAAALGIVTIADLASHATDFVIAGDMSFFARTEWANVKQSYDLNFKEFRPMDSNLMYAAIGNGVDVICAYTTDGRVEEKGLVILKDPHKAFPPYDAMLLVSARAYKDERCRNSLLALVGAIDEKLMGSANLQVDVHGKSPREAAGVIVQALSK